MLLSTVRQRLLFWNSNMLEKKNEKDAKPNVLGELIIPVFGVVFTTYYFSTIIDSPWTAQVNAVMVGLVLFLICTIFFIRKSQVIKLNQARIVLEYKRFWPAIFKKQTGFIAITVGYLLIIEYLGYTLATIIFFFLSMSLLDGGRHKIVKLALSLTMAAIGYVVFILMFETRLPLGFIELSLREVIR